MAGTDLRAGTGTQPGKVLTIDNDGAVGTGEGEQVPDLKLPQNSKAGGEGIVTSPAGGGFKANGSKINTLFAASSSGKFKMHEITIADGGAPDLTQTFGVGYGLYFLTAQAFESMWLGLFTNTQGLVEIESVRFGMGFESTPYFNVYTVAGGERVKVNNNTGLSTTRDLLIFYIG